MTARGHARFVEGVCFPKLVAQTLKAHVASGVPVQFRARIEGGRVPVALTHNQANKKMDARFNEA